MSVVAFRVRKEATMQTIVRHGTGARIVVKSDTPAMVKTLGKGFVRVSVGVSPIVSTPTVPAVALAKSA
jgi:hypothetical protein